jgi:hypothetical protein
VAECQAEAEGHLRVIFEVSEDGIILLEQEAIQ